ncbi:MAG: hypothetical protein PT944_06720 [Actinomycetaceae bacterium]|nr:hypothetical protein [Arcanobacterium sp.]MDD7687584.1 hypothetical protein [Actinomycetaceae bacterium]MDY5273178.1 hypothetical protein [Arcanobacterium sp.]
MAALVKHEWRLNGFAIVGIVLAQVACLILGTLLGYLPVQWNPGVIISVQVVMWLCTGVGVVLVAVILFMSYFRSMHGSLAAFTASTPISLGWHYAVKLVWAVVALFVSVAVMIFASFSIFTEINGRGAYPMSQRIWQHGAGVIGRFIKDNPSLVAILCVAVLFGVLSLAIEGAFVITIGRSERLAKFGSYGGIVLMVALAWAARNLLSLAGLLIPLGLRIHFAASDALRIGADIGFVPVRVGTLEYQDTFPVGMLISMTVLLVVLAAITLHSLRKQYSLR